MPEPEIPVDYYENLDLKSIQTPIDVNKLRHLLIRSRYDLDKTNELVEGFTNGFDIGYRGPAQRQDVSNNIPLHIGSLTEIWNKIMKEVKLGRVAGPFENIPFQNYIQSPIGLVPKAGNQTRLIFHLSFDFGQDDASKSLNYHTPKDLCKVKYRDLDYAIARCLELDRLYDDISQLFFSKSDLKSAFRILPLKISQFCWLCFKARDPKTGKFWFFADKCLPFGASISCALFTKFSDCLKHLSEFLSGKFTVTNYLDDFLFIAESEGEANRLVRIFLNLCQFINCPVAMEKTEWASSSVVFLGILMQGKNRCLSIPQEKITKARNAILAIINKPKKKATIKEIQGLTGLLNFLNKAIVPGRAFTRRMYAKIPGISYDKETNQIKTNLKWYHHVRLDAEFLADCNVWLQFLQNCTAREICRPFMDLDMITSSIELNFYTDSSRAISKGFGCIFNTSWCFGKWEPGYIEQFQPSIQYLELYALCVGIFAWQEKLANMRIRIFCDNDAVKQMVNHTTSGCKNSMLLIRLLVLNCIKYNRRITVQFVASKDNGLADALSRMEFNRFWRNAPANMDCEPSELPAEIWPASKIWLY